jgi:hypothetical protein
MPLGYLRSPRTRKLVTTEILLLIRFLMRVRQQAQRFPFLLQYMRQC